jgi:hypothetical protein
MRILSESHNIMILIS